MKYLLFLLIPVLSFGQKKIIYIDSFPITLQDVKMKMQKYNKSHSNNHFWEINVVKNPTLETEDSIIYNNKFITKHDGMLLWGSKTKFTKVGTMVYCEVSNLIQLKKSQIFSDIQYINMKADEMEDTIGNQINLEAIKKEVQSFFKYFK